MPTTQSIPGLARWTILVVSVLLVVTGLAGAVVGQVVPPKPSWALIGFELVIAFSAVFGVMTGLGRVREAPALAVLCVSGAALAGSVLGYLAIKATLSHLPLKAFLALRLAMALALGACSVVIALGGERRAWRTLVRAVLFGIPLVGVALWYRFYHLAPLIARPASVPDTASGTSSMSGAADALRISAIALVGLACGVCVCAVVHLTIRAFVLADEARSRESQPST